MSKNDKLKTKKNISSRYLRKESRWIQRMLSQHFQISSCSSQSTWDRNHHNQGGPQQLRIIALWNLLGQMNQGPRNGGLKSVGFSSSTSHDTSREVNHMVSLLEDSNSQLDPAMQIAKRFSTGGREE
eukprot:scaffold12306_cov109-Cylindrotheca_fusiformis.AAC.3